MKCLCLRTPSLDETSDEWSIDHDVAQAVYTIESRANHVWMDTVGTLIVGSPERQIVGVLIVRFLEHQLSHPYSGSDSNGGSEPSLGRETIYWDSLPVFFFNLIKISYIQRYQNKTTIVVVFTLSIHTNYPEPHLLIHIQKQNFTFQLHIQSAEPTVMNPY